jgi:hypothetical protein
LQDNASNSLGDIVICVKKEHERFVSSLQGNGNEVVDTGVDIRHPSTLKQLIDGSISGGSSLSTLEFIQESDDSNMLKSSRPLLEEK